jgi:chromosome segregation ATPase
MNQPTEDHIRQIKERQAEFEKRLIDMERYISPIKFTQLEIDSGRIFRKLDEIQKNTNITKIQTEGVSGDLLQIRESQVDMRDRLIEHGQRLKSIEDKQEAHTEILGQLMNFGEETKEALGEHSNRFDRIEAAQNEHSNRFDRIEAAQNEHSARFDRFEAIMMQILNRLPQPEEE